MKNSRVFWATLVAAVVVVILFHAWNSAFDHDEVQHLHASWLIGSGEIPFTGFLEQHHPTLWYLAAPIVSAMKSPHHIVFVARIFDLILLAAFAWIFCAIARLVFPYISLRWAVLLLISSFTFTRNSMEFRPDPIMNLLAFAGLYAWLVYLKEKRFRAAALAGFLAGASIAFLQKSVVFISLFFAASTIVEIMACYKDGGTKRILKGTFLCVACASAVVAVLFLFIAHAGYWEDFVFWNYSFNSFLYLKANVAAHFGIWRTVWQSFIHCPVIWIAGIAGAILMVLDIWEKRGRLVFEQRAQIAILVVTVGYFLSLVCSRFPFDHYFIAWLPLMVLFSIPLFQWMQSRGVAQVFKVAVLLMVIELSAILILYPTNSDARRVQNFILDNTSASEAIFASPPNNPISRLDGAYFWYNSEMIAGAYQEYCANRKCPGDALGLEDSRWRNLKPAYVYIDPKYPEYHPYRWDLHAADYKKTEIEGLFKRAR